MIAVILRETTPGERRVAMVPKVAEKLIKQKVEIRFEPGCGTAAGFSDADYSQIGCTPASRAELLSNADLVFAINPLGADDLKQVKAGSAVTGVYAPYTDPAAAEIARQFPAHVFSLDMLPRTTLAQSMDVLSSMASVAGYEAVVIAAGMLPRYFPMMITAAGTIAPAKVLVLGAGVAGLQAIATAKRLGATVEAFDTRSAAKEEVESLGAKFVEVEGAVEDKGAGGYGVEQSEDFIRRQRAEVQARAAKSDVVICTAQVRGKKAPILVTADTVRNMRPGSVIIDLAASTGGNCELTENNKTIDVNGVQILGDSNLPNRVASDSSTLFANNLFNFAKLFITKEGQMELNLEHELLKASKL